MNWRYDDTPEMHEPTESEISVLDDAFDSGYEKCKEKIKEYFPKCDKCNKNSDNKECLKCYSKSLQGIIKFVEVENE